MPANFRRYPRVITAENIDYLRLPVFEINQMLWRNPLEELTVILQVPWLVLGEEKKGE